MSTDPILAGDAARQILKHHYRMIGHKGGTAGRGSPARRRAAKGAAETRWRRRHPAPKEIDEEPLTT